MLVPYRFILVGPVPVPVFGHGVIRVVEVRTLFMFVLELK
jgi:hypothetical protein